jgi:hypothetical protein
MGDSFQKVQPGDALRIPAPVYNALIDLVRNSGRGTGAGPSKPSTKDWGIVSILNDTSIDLDVGHVLGIEGPLINPPENEYEFCYRLHLTGIAPLEASHTGKFAVAVEPIPAGGIRRACVSGLCVARVNVTDEDETDWADVSNGDTDYLAAGASGGAQILWIESGTGIKWAIVRVGGGGSDSKHWGTLDAALAYNNSTGVDVTLDIGGTQAGVLPPKGMTEGTFPQDANVLIELVDGEWYVTYCAECAE